jgi:hypothetical protein
MAISMVDGREVERVLKWV